LIDKFKKTHYYRANDAINSLATGITQVVVNSYFFFITKGPYMWLYENYAIWKLPIDSPYTWWLAFIGIDFGYYCTIFRMDYR